VVLTVPEAVAFPSASVNVLATLLEKEGIQFLTGRRPVVVDYVRKVAFFSNGDKLSYQLLVAQFPRVAPKCLVESRLATPTKYVFSQFANDQFAV